MIQEATNSNEQIKEIKDVGQTAVEDINKGKNIDNIVEKNKSLNIAKDLLNNQKNT